MLDAVVGLLSQDLALDPGSSRLRVHMRNVGLVRDMPALVGIQSVGDRRRWLAVGDAARRMVGRTAGSVSVVRPFDGGVPRDAEIASALIATLNREIHGRRSLVRPRTALALGGDVDSAGRQAWQSVLIAAGVREVRFVHRSFAAARGADLDVTSPHAWLVADVGASGTELSLLAGGRAVAVRRVAWGGDAADLAVAERVRERHNIELGPAGAEAVKIAAAGWSNASPSTLARGRCAHRGLPMRAPVTHQDLAGCLDGGVRLVAASIRRLLEETSGELADDVMERGFVLTGGGAQLRGLDAALRIATGIAVVAADQPDRAVVRGVGTALDDGAALRAWAA